MSLELEIVCIKKDGGYHYNPHTGITHFGCKGLSSLMTKKQMIMHLRDDSNSAFVQGKTKKVYCTVVGDYPDEYVKTIPDGKEANNLLSLPECGA